jgi:hypothetical protein
MTDRVREVAVVHSRYILSSVCPASSVKGREIGVFLPVKMLVHAKSTSRVCPRLYHESADQAERWRFQTSIRSEGQKCKSSGDKKGV